MVPGCVRQAEFFREVFDNRLRQIPPTKKIAEETFIAAEGFFILQSASYASEAVSSGKKLFHDRQ